MRFNIVTLRGAIFTYLMMLFISSSAQKIFPPPSYEKKPRIEAIKVQEKITLDGKLTESDWMRCSVATNFLQTYPSEKAKASYETVVRILYDENNIYIGIVCQNPGNKILVQNLKRDFGYGSNELFAVLFDPFQNVQNPIPAFSVTPYSSQADLLITDDRINDYNWDAVWRAKSFITDSSWCAEMEIPWTSLRYPSDSTTWGINFARTIRSKYEFTGWSIWPMAYNAGRMAYAGLVTNLHPPKSKANIRLQPYALLNSAKFAGKERNVKTQIGGEVKWFMNTYTSLEATVNTDFAQADVDRQVINLNRSSVFFPERRQFFLDNASLFAVGQDGIIQPFFSRRIGLDEKGNPQKINGGLRFIHQTGKQALGALIINQKDNDTSTNSWFGVVRGQKNVGINGRIGSLITFRHDEKTNTTNTVISIDGLVRPSVPFYLRPMVSASLPNGKHKAGFVFFNELGFAKNNILFNWYQTIVTRNYNAGTGFLARNNFVNTRPEVTLNFRKHWFNDRVNYFKPSLKFDIYHTASDLKFQEANISVAPFWVTFRNGAGFASGMDSYFQSLQNIFKPVPAINIAPGKYSYFRPFVDFYTNQGAKYSINASLSWGQFYNGTLSSYEATLRMVPVPKIATGVRVVYNSFSGFNTANKKIRTYLIAPEIRASLNPKIHLTGFYQYNTVTNLGGLNMRFSWEYRPLSFIYLVFNNLKTIDSQLTPTRVNDNTGILKVSYIRQL